MFYNEEASLSNVCRGIAEWQAKGKYGHCLKDWRLINDGSEDSSLRIAKDFEKTHSFFRIISLNGNFGKGWAFRQGAEDLLKLDEGLDESIIVQIDGDLAKLKPANIDALIENLIENVHISAYKGPRVASIALVPLPRARLIWRIFSTFWAKRNLAISGQRAYFGYTLKAVLPNIRLGTGFGLELVTNQSLIERFRYLAANYGIKQRQRKELIGVINWENVQHMVYKEKFSAHRRSRHYKAASLAFLASHFHYLRVFADSVLGFIIALPRRWLRRKQR